MRRRSLLKGLLASAGLAGSWTIKRTHAQDASPGVAESAPSAAGILPIRWRLLSIDIGDDSLIPDAAAEYWVQFLSGNLVLLQADCNGGSGTFSTEGDSIAITGIVTTLIGCGEGSIADEFLAGLQAAKTFAISSDGSDQLALETNNDGSRLLFGASLIGVTWRWEQFRAADDTVFEPDTPGRYTIQFAEDGSVLVQADCNNGRGQSVVDGNQIDMTVAATRKACGEDSAFEEFMRTLDESTSFSIEGGKLYLNLPEDGGSARFSPIPPASPDGAATPSTS